MEPLSSLTAAAIATLVITKTFEKVGEKLGDEVFTEGGKLVQLIRQHSPQTAGAIEIAQKTPDDFGQAVLENVEAEAKHPEIAAALEKVAEIAKADPNFGKAIQKLAKQVPTIVKEINAGKLVDNSSTTHINNHSFYQPKWTVNTVNQAQRDIYNTEGKNSVKLEDSAKGLEDADAQQSTK